MTENILSKSMIRDVKEAFEKKVLFLSDLPDGKFLFVPLNDCQTGWVLWAKDKTTPPKYFKAHNRSEAFRCSQEDPTYQNSDPVLFMLFAIAIPRTKDSEFKVRGLFISSRPIIAEIIRVQESHEDTEVLRNHKWILFKTKKSENSFSYTITPDTNYDAIKDAHVVTRYEFTKEELLSLERNKYNLDNFFDGISIFETA